MTSPEMIEAKPLRVYLIRHGETEWSLSGRHTGLTDLLLTVNGQQEALQLKTLLQGLHFSRVLSSPLQRARQTCDLLELDTAAEIEMDLLEWNYGDYDGLTTADIHKQRPYWNVFLDGCPNGEMPEQMTERVDRLITRLRLLKGNVALFSHGQIGGVIAARWIGLPLLDAQHFPLGTASLSVLGYDLHHPEISVIDLWNAKQPYLAGQEQKSTLNT
ncbi:histidine phosphatase family protein [Methylomonas sp. AM2-LC]|uniref:histidine phosphatase family protein n=1 Tax=Methylomonas sp. AM2-LC TaxID=3153301 RepID=UPI003262E81C